MVANKHFHNYYSQYGFYKLKNGNGREEDSDNIEMNKDTDELEDKSNVEGNKDNMGVNRNSNE